FLLAATLPCQRQVRQITKLEEPHFDCQISPDGKMVAFRGKGNKIAVVDVGGSKETDLVTGANLGNFVWAPSNAGIYFMDGSTVKFVSKSGGVALPIGSGKGAMFLWSVDRADKTIYGTRRDNNNNYYVFSLATSGSATPQDLVTIAANYWVEQVCVDLAAKKLAYFVSVQGVHQPKDLRVADINGKNETSWSGGAKLASPTRNLAWADAGTTAIFTTVVTTTSTTWQIGRLTATNSTVEFLTRGPKHHQRSVTGGNLAWIAFQSETVGFRHVPAVIPSAGGGRVLLEPEQDWVFQGDPSIDAAGQKVAFAASVYVGGKLTTSQIYLVELDREVVISPRAVPGGKIDIKLPVDKGEKGMLFVSIALLPKPVPIVGFTYGVAINTNVMVQMINGVGDGTTPLQLLNLPIPNDSNLKGIEVFLQGIRSKDGNTGDLTRYVELEVQ
ncbi:MAG: TolB family protein, partial [Planctomycetota bacterium]